MVSPSVGAVVLVRFPFSIYQPASFDPLLCLLVLGVMTGFYAKSPATHMQIPELSKSTNLILQQEV